MEKLGKERIKNVSGGQMGLFKDEKGKTWYLLYDKGQIPGEIKLDKVRDAGVTTEYWAKQGKYLKEFVSENGVTGFITDDKGVAMAHKERFD